MNRPYIIRPNASVGHPRRPRLGQHFLRDPRLRRRVMEALSLRADDLVIEIGAGRGEMTRLLAERARRVVAVELDVRLAETLRLYVQDDPRIEVIHRDILTTDLADLCRSRDAEKCFVFGNLPYYITSPILHRLYSFWKSIRSMALIVQEEVAERLTAVPGTRAYGYLSVATQLHSQSRIVLRIPAGAFSPPPKVTSALVSFEIGPRWSPREIKSEAAFLDFVQRCFAQKRKNLLNNLARSYSRREVEALLGRLEWPPQTRAEELSIELFIDLFRHLRH